MFYKGAPIKDLPLEIVILEMAQEWSVPPWEVESKATKAWVDWWLIKRGGQAQAMEYRNREQQRKSMQRRKR